MKILHLILFSYILFLFNGCAPDKPSDNVINDFIATKLKRTVNEINLGSYHRIDVWYDDLKIVNQWADENIKGVYYIKISCVNEVNTVASKIEETWRFKKEGDLWVPDKDRYEHRFIENTSLRYN